MKKSTIIILVTIGIGLLLKFGILFETKSKITKRINVISKYTIEQTIPNGADKIVLTGNTRLKVLKNETNKIKLNTEICTIKTTGSEIKFSSKNSTLEDFKELYYYYIETDTHPFVKISTTDSSRFYTKEPIIQDSIILSAKGNSSERFTNIKARLVRIDCNDKAYIKISNLECDSLVVFANDKGRVKIKQGKIKSMSGKVSGHAKLSHPSAENQNITKDKSAIIRSNK